MDQDQTNQDLPLLDEATTATGAIADAREPAATSAERQDKKAGLLGLLATDLCKQFKRRRVVDGVSLSISPGEVVGLLGPNGAGKTTSFHMILGLVPPNSGRVSLGGGYMPIEELDRALRRRLLADHLILDE